MSDSPEPQPQPEEDEDKAWAKAAPRLKGFFREALDEYFAEADTDPDKKDIKDDGAGAAGGSAPAAGGTGGEKAPAQKRISGFSITDFLLGKAR